MARDTEIKASEWLAVRREIAVTIMGRSHVKDDTADRMAETLLENGYIDIPAVLEALEPEPAERETLEKVAAALKPQVDEF